MSTWKRRWAIGLGMASLLYVAECGYMWATQKSHVFEPTLIWQTTPDRMGMKYDELHIPAGGGAGDLDAWWVPAEAADGHGMTSGYAARSPHPVLPPVREGENESLRELQVNDAPTVLYFHGNDRNISNHLEQTQHLHQLGYNVLLADYRGYGKSGGGKPSETKVYEDAEAVWKYWIKWRGGQPGKTFIYGHSLGGAIAINLALHHPEAAGLIVESTFTSMQAMGEINYAYLPVSLLLNQRFESLKKMPQLKLPVLIIHGTWDPRVPVEMARQLYAAAPEPKKLLLIEGGEHSDSGTIGWVQFRDTVSTFVRKYVR